MSCHAPGSCITGNCYVLYIHVTFMLSAMSLHHGWGSIGAAVLPTFILVTHLQTGISQPGRPLTTHSVHACMHACRRRSLTPVPAQCTDMASSGTPCVMLKVDGYRCCCERGPAVREISTTEYLESSTQCLYSHQPSTAFGACAWACWSPVQVCATHKRTAAISCCHLPWQYISSHRGELGSSLPCASCVLHAGLASSACPPWCGAHLSAQARSG